MTDAELASVYKDYIACLNAQNWTKLGHFVADDVEHNGSVLGLQGYRKMLENDFAEIPDLQFNVEMLVVEPPNIVSRLRFKCSPSASFLGLRINGRTVSFAENVFYEFRGAKIARVWSVIDKAAIEAQL